MMLCIKNEMTDHYIHLILKVKATQKSQQCQLHVLLGNSKVV